MFENMYHVLDLFERKKIVLGSGSPRRSQLLKMMGLKFEVNPSQFDERSLKKSEFEHPREYVEHNAQRKVKEVASRMAKEDYDLIIASDTIVVQDEKILEKPLHEEEAFAMIQHLSGQTHYVATAVALAFHDTNGELVVESFCTTTDVTFAELSRDQIDHYIKHGDWHDKAGGYGIQSVAGAFVKTINGDYYTVVGFPIQRLSEKLCEWIQIHAQP
eukprot:m.21443 g.21443  ORF g.21443 m.21443 type:complete len:216 (+) comp5351_c0_seq1:105-752(+)